MFGAISETFRTFDMQINFAIFFPPPPKKKKIINLTFDGGWGNSFPFFKVARFLSLYQSTCYVIIGHFTTFPNY